MRARSAVVLRRCGELVLLGACVLTGVYRVKSSEGEATASLFFAALAVGAVGLLMVFIGWLNGASGSRKK